MKFYLSSSCYNEPNLFKNLTFLNNLNVKNIELSAPHGFLNNEQILSILKLFSNINFITHNFFPPQIDDFVMNLSSENKNIIEKSEKLFDDTVKISKFVGSKIYGFHPGYLFDAIHLNKKFVYSDIGIPYNVAERNSINFVKKLLNKYTNFYFLLENLFPEVDKETSIFCKPSEISNYFSNFEEPNLGLLLDLGHLNISAKFNGIDVFTYLDEILNKHLLKIKEIHLSENNGYHDQHLSLKNGSWQFEALKIIYSRIKATSNAEDIIVCLETRNSPMEETLNNLKYLNNVYN